MNPIQLALAVLELAVDASRLTAGMKEAEAKAKGSGENVGKGFSNALNTSLLGVQAIFGVLQRAVLLGEEALGEFIEKGKEAVTLHAELAAATGQSTAAIDAFAEAELHSIGIRVHDTEALAVQIAKITQFSGDALIKATQAAINWAAISGKSFEAAARDVDRFIGTGAALGFKRYGIALQDTGDKMSRLDELSAKMARGQDLLNAVAATGAGRMDKLAGEIDNAKEKLGEAILNSQGFNQAFDEMARILQQMADSGELEKIGTGIGNTTKFLVTFGQVAVLALTEFKIYIAELATGFGAMEVYLAKAYNMLATATHQHKISIEALQLAWNDAKKTLDAYKADATKITDAIVVGQQKVTVALAAKNKAHEETNALEQKQLDLEMGIRKQYEEASPALQKLLLTHKDVVKALADTKGLAEKNKDIFAEEYKADEKALKTQEALQRKIAEAAKQLLEHQMAIRVKYEEAAPALQKLLILHQDYQAALAATADKAESMKDIAAEEYKQDEKTVELDKKKLELAKAAYAAQQQAAESIISAALQGNALAVQYLETNRQVLASEQRILDAKWAKLTADEKEAALLNGELVANRNIAGAVDAIAASWQNIDNGISSSLDHVTQMGKRLSEMYDGIRAFGGRFADAALAPLAFAGGTKNDPEYLQAINFSAPQILGAPLIGPTNSGLQFEQLAAYRNELGLLSRYGAGVKTPAGGFQSEQELLAAIHAAIQQLTTVGAQQAARGTRQNPTYVSNVPSPGTNTTDMAALAVA